MKRRSSYAWIVSVIVLGFVPAVFAQADEAEEGRGFPERAEQRRVGTREIIKLLESFHADMVKALDLDEAFDEELTDLFEEHVEAMRAQEAADEETRRESAEAMRAMVKEMREAHREGDRDRAAEIRKEIEVLRQKGNQPNDAYLKLFEDIRQMLDEEQLPVFNKLADEFTARLDQGDGRSEIRLLHRAASMVEMSDEQKESMRNIFLQARRDARELGDSPDELKKLVESIQRMILEELDETQAADFNKKLEELRAEEEKSVPDHKRVRTRERTPQPTDDPASADEPGKEKAPPAEPTNEDPDGDPEEDIED